MKKNKAYTARIKVVARWQLHRSYNTKQLALLILKLKLERCSITIKLFVILREQQTSISVKKYTQLKQEGTCITET